MTARQRLLATLGIASILSTLVLPGHHAGAAVTWRTLTYGGERFSVPSSWPVDDLATAPSTCVRFDRHAVYLGREGSTPSCPPMVAGVADAVQVEPLDALGRSEAGPHLLRATVGGQQTFVNRDQAVTQRLVAAFPQAGVLVTISFGGSRATAERILTSFTPSGAVSGAPRPIPSTAPRPTAATGDLLPSAVASTGAASVVAGPAPFTGLGFDACAAPSEPAMAAWRASSPFRAVGVYIGGANRACGNGWLSSGWVGDEVAAGWNLIPLYVGLQASCAFQGGLAAITTGRATAEGIQAAQNAVAEASYFGMGAGSPIYYDMEAWDTTNRSCSRAVVNFVKAWSRQLVAQGYVSGIYGSAGAGIGQDIAPLYGHPGGPTMVDVADWDGVANTYVPYLPSGAWSDHQRIKQFFGGANETYGGVTIGIDGDYSDATLVGDPRPGVTAISPSRSAVGTTVTVVGQAFVGGRTSVGFGGVPARDVKVMSSSRLTARVPARSLTAVDVTVTTPGGTSATGSAEFVYTPVVATAANGTTGYWVATAGGRVFAFHSAWLGSAAGRPLPAPVVGMAADTLTGGYWVAGADGGVHSYRAPAYPPGAGRLAAPVVGMAAAPGTGGYWLVTTKGNIYNYGVAWLGSTKRMALPAPIVGMAADPATGGYWLAAANGTVYAFHAPTSPPVTSALTGPIVGIAADPATGGYWLAGADGAVYPSNAPNYGSAAGRHLRAPAVAITSTPTGYLLTTAAGTVIAFHTPWRGSPAALG